MDLLSVDCGVRGCGVAAFVSGVLVSATYVKNPMRHGQGGYSALAMAKAVREAFEFYQPDQLAIETMRIYEAGDQKGDQNDLLGVQLVAGCITGILNVLTRSYTPSEWKGTIDADVCTERILERLSIKEKQAIVRVSESVDHNTIDGVGIGLKHLGRFEPRRVFARE